MDYFRGSRPFSQLLRIISRLPPESHYKAAYADDDEIAEILFSIGFGKEDGPPGPPPIVGYSSIHAKLDDIADQIGSFSTWYMNSKTNGKAGPFRRRPRPIGALQRRVKQSRLAKLNDLEQRLLGNR